MGTWGHVTTASGCRRSGSSPRPRCSPPPRPPPPLADTSSRPPRSTGATRPTSSSGWAWVTMTNMPKVRRNEKGFRTLTLLWWCFRLLRRWGRWRLWRGGWWRWRLLRRGLWPGGADCASQRAQDGRGAPQVRPQEARRPRGDHPPAERQEGLQPCSGEKSKLKVLFKDLLLILSIRLLTSFSLFPCSHRRPLMPRIRFR